MTISRSRFSPRSGYSLGLDYRYVFGRLTIGAGSIWAVWDRDSGEVVDLVPRRGIDVVQLNRASELCHEWNALSLWPDAATLADIDATP